MKSKKPYRGFTLIEIIVSLNIIAIGIVFLFYTHKLNITNISSASINYTATNLLKEKIEEINTFGIDHLPEVQGRINKNNTNFEWSITHSPYSQINSRIKISIRWTEKNGIKEKYLTSII